MSESLDLKSLLLPSELSPEELERRVRKVYFEELVPNPPKLAVFPWLDNLPLTVTNSEGAFQHIFGQSSGWSSYHHGKTGLLEPTRMQRVNWIRPVLEMQAKGIKIYVNNHSMKGRGFGPKEKVEKKRLYVVTQTGLQYFISLKYLENSLVLTTAFEPDGRWLREMLKKHGTTLVGP